MAESSATTVSEKTPRRLANWDLLRAISMFAVVVVHMSGYLGPIGGVPTNAIGVLQSSATQFSSPFPDTSR